MFIRHIHRVGVAVIKNLQQTPIPRTKFCLVLLPTNIVWSQKFNLTDDRRNSNGNGKNMATSENFKDAKSIYDFTVKDTYGNDVSLEKYRGHVVLIVNIASQCGLTKNNYRKITELKEKYFEKGLRILSFPCNQFGSQMPENDGEEMVCHLKSANADVGDVFQKIDVNGDNAHPLYKYLKHKQGGTFGDAIKWNFTKFLVDKNGQPVDRFAPTTDPMDIGKSIEKLL